MFFSNIYCRDHKINKKLSAAIFSDTIYFNPFNEKGQNPSVNELASALSSLPRSPFLIPMD